MRRRDRTNIGGHVAEAAASAVTLAGFSDFPTSRIDLCFSVKRIDSMVRFGGNFLFVPRYFD
ncbi:hypothetical protein DYH55_17300 [Methylovirgula sp. 4M-Z18]|nr:hypothetical protein DYH55_17300 [Methylovirgula sp. 4M-Z18]